MPWLWILFGILWLVAGDLGSEGAARRWGKYLTFGQSFLLSFAGPAWFVYNELYDLTKGFTHRL